MASEIYRQGDVLLMQVAALPQRAREVDSPDDGRIVLAFGEVTGHAHALSTASAQLYEAGSERFLVASAGATLVHEEHSAIKLNPGVYRVIQQREYTPEAVRYVVD